MLFFDLVDLLRGSVAEVIEGTGLESIVNGAIGESDKSKGVKEGKDEFIDRFVKVRCLVSMN